MKSADRITRLVHAGQEVDVAYNAVTAPIYQTSVFRYEEVGKSKGYEYSRAANPTRHSLESLIADLEGGAGAVATATGVGALTTAISIFDAGVHVIVSHDCYGGTARLLDLLQQQGKLSYSYVDLSEPAALESAVRPQSRVLWVESPTNPLLRIVDLERLGAAAKRHGLCMIVDNTFMTPLWQRPFEFGADIVVHSTTKYLNGHADVISGAVVARDEVLLKKIRLLVRAFGWAAAPFDTWLVLRGAKTLALRLQRHQENAMAVAEFLLGQPNIEEVFYPGLPSHPGHALARRQQGGFGGVVTVKLRGGGEAAKQFVRSTRLFALTDSLGGVESTINQSAFMSHAGMPREQRLRAGITDNTVRLSVGIESPQDLLDDLGEALSRVGG